MKISNAAIALLLALACSRAVLSCTSYTHLWQPVKETKTSFINSYDLVEFLKDKIGRFDKTSKKWFIAINPASDMASEVKTHVASAVLNIMDYKKYIWDDKLSPFDDFQPKENTGYVWLDVVNPTHLKFIWQDMNGPPMSMFRMGEFDTASIRMLIQSDKKEVLLIDEFPYQNSFESDIMTPTWTTLGGIWLRRVSRRTVLMKNRKEWTVATPPSLEEMNSAVDGIERIYLENKHKKKAE